MCSVTEEIDRMKERFREGNTLGSVKLYIHLCSTLNVPLLLELSEYSVFSVCISAFQRKKEKNSC